LLALEGTGEFQCFIGVYQSELLDVHAALGKCDVQGRVGLPGPFGKAHPQVIKHHLLAGLIQAQGASRLAVIKGRLTHLRGKLHLTCRAVVGCLQLELFNRECPCLRLARQ
jgi:hypothetical protein